MRKMKQGSILIVILFVMSVLGLTAVSFAYRTGIHLRMARRRSVMASLESQAISAVEVAISRLRANTNEFDHWAEPWHSHRPLSDEGWLPEWQADREGGTLDYQVDYHVIDEEGKLHVAYASGDALEKLGMSPSQISSVLDWMDENSSAEPEGAEHEYYQSLAEPYRCKNAAMNLLDELLLVRGITSEDYLGEDHNKNRLLDGCEKDGPVSYPPDDGDDVLRLGWVDLLTCRGEGKININTAARQVLLTLPIREEAVDQILAYRRYDHNSTGDLERHVFAGEEDIRQLQGLTETEADILAERCIFRSRHFRIFAQAVHIPTGLRYHIQVLVKSGDGQVETIYWKSGV
jgi:hypothetical protein